MAQPSPKRITIAGTGLIGGSIGLALKSQPLEGLEIIGYDRDRSAANQAQKMGAVDKAEHNAARAVRGAGMVIVATPVLAVHDAFEEMAPHLDEGAVVTDTASTKAAVMRWARDVLPERVHFVGGHPMAGKETSGIQQADPNLFRGKAYCICPSINASPEAVRGVVGLAQLIGAEPLFMDAEEHDQYAAAVSHLPLMMATALFSMLRASPSWPDIGPMASTGFRDATRLASGDPAMSHGIWRTNREAVIHWLERMASELLRFRDMLKDAKDDELLELFVKAQMDRDSFLREPVRRGREPVADVDAGRALMTMLVGGMMAEQLRKAQRLSERDQQPQVRRPSPQEEKPRPSLADKIAEDVRRDLERLEKKGEGGDEAEKEK
jgi:prephenate dehydrogenase